MFQPARIFRATALSLALLAGVSTAVTLVTYDYAYAGKGGNGNGNGGKSDAAKDKSKGNNGTKAKSRGSDRKSATSRSGGGRGLLDSIFKSKSKKTRSAKRTKPAKDKSLAATLGVHPSELGALNAAHASPNALANASPNSRVGRIAIYAERVGETQMIEADLLEAQEILDGLEEPTRSVDDIDVAIMDAQSEKSLLEGALMDLQDQRDMTEGPTDELDMQITELGDEITALDGEINSLNQERDDAVAYNDASDAVSDLEMDLADAQTDQRSALEDAANKEVTDEVEVAVQKLLGIYQEPEFVEEFDDTELDELSTPQG